MFYFTCNVCNRNKKRFSR